jgi:hypothetical protein
LGGRLTFLLASAGVLRAIATCRCGSVSTTARRRRCW